VLFINLFINHLNQNNMPVKFKAVQRPNPKNPAEPAKFYASATPSGKCDIDKLSRIISKNSTVSRTDVYAVIMGLLDAISDELADGNTIYMGKLGSYSIAVKSEGVTTAAELTGAAIKSAKINYRAGAELKNMLKTLSFEKKTDAV
jgi:predicted histone-like DNA-binding protein